MKNLSVSVFLMFAYCFFHTQAQVITVTSSGDSGHGTFRNAIASANPGDEIQFSLPTGSTINLSSGPLSISKSIKITGSGSNELTIDANNSSGIFEINNTNSVEISGLTIQNGSGSDGGGILLNNAGASIADLVIQACSSIISGGGIFASNSNLEISNSEISNNSAGQNGGGIMAANSSSVTISDTRLENNTAGNSGGGICSGNSSSYSLSVMTFGSNEAGLECPTICVLDPGMSSTKSDSPVFISSGSFDLADLDDVDCDCEGHGPHVATSRFSTVRFETKSPVEVPLYLVGYGPRPLSVNAPAGNVFTVRLTRFDALPSRAYWEIEHLSGSLGSGATLELVYAKEDVPSYSGNMESESYIFKLSRGQWSNITPSGATTTDWYGSSSYWSTSVTGISSFSGFAPVGLNMAIPVLPGIMIWLLISALSISALIILFKNFS